MSPGAEVALLEAGFWQAPDAARLAAFQAACRTREQQRQDVRHRFVVVVPVADRPQQLQACLDSLVEQCRLYGYGWSLGSGEGNQHISILIADDSREPENICRHQQLAQRTQAQGLPTEYFGLDEQRDLLDKLSAAQRTVLSGVLGEGGVAHKGASAMRNIVYLRLAALADVHTLFYFIDSDQTFQVRIPAPDGERDVYALDYFYQLDRIFSQTDTLVLTGKVVGDPPVSPSVMAANFLADVGGFLQAVTEVKLEARCTFHTASTPAASTFGGDAAYHDMAALFGFKERTEAFSYACPLCGQHTNADALTHFANNLNGFFHGEHPTRKSRYQYQDALASLQPARTVYTGNYCFRAPALKYFIPFARLKLRMAGPVLGRILKAQLGERFVTANLPMLHARTLNAGDAYEFRPGVAAKDDVIDLSGELERQFYGDVMLFTIDKLIAQGYPGEIPEENQAAEILQTTRQEMASLYAEKRELVMARLEMLTRLMRDRVWSETVSTQLQNFADNIANNFGGVSPGYAKIEQHAARRQTEMIEAVVSYVEDQLAWEAVLSSLS